MPSNEEIIPVHFLNRTELISTVPHMAQSIEKLLNRDVPIPILVNSRNWNWYELIGIGIGIDMIWLELRIGID